MQFLINLIYKIRSFQKSLHKTKIKIKKPKKNFFPVLYKSYY